MDSTLTLHGLIGGSSTLIEAPQPYTRPSDWLPLPSVNSGDNKFVGLIAVFDDQSNFISVRATGAYTVDWGDGTIENIASNVQANHNYDYNNVNLNPTVCSRGYKMAIVVITPQVGETFSVLNLNVKHPQASLQKYETGWLDIAVSGASLSTINIASNGTVTTPVNYNAMLEIVKIIDKSPLLTSYAYLFTECRSLKSVSINSSNVTNFSNMFKNCSTLMYLPVFDTSTGVIFSSMFSGCSALREIPYIDMSNGLDFSNCFNSCQSIRSIPLLDFSSGTDFTGCFIGCTALRTLPVIDTSSGITFTSMFNGCKSLQTIPLINTSLGQYFNSMFSGCDSLQTIPLINTSQALDLSSMFALCPSLRLVPQLNTPLCTNFNSMFLSCQSLQDIPLLNTINGLNFSSMFSGCASIRTIPSLNTINGTSFNLMFNNCKNLQNIPDINTSSGTNFTDMFSGCNSLQTLGNLNLINGTSFGTMFLNCSSLGRNKIYNSKRTLSLINCSMSQSSLVEFFNNLGVAINARVDVSYTSTGSGPYTVTVTSIAHGLNTGNTINVYKASDPDALVVSIAITKLTNDTFSYIIGVGDPSAGTLSYRTITNTQTITVTGNWGSSSLTAGEKEICTNKGYTLAL